MNHEALTKCPSLTRHLSIGVARNKANTNFNKREEKKKRNRSEDSAAKGWLKNYAGKKLELLSPDKS